MIYRGQKALRLIGCVALDEGSATFALPLFAHPVDFKPMIQIIDEIANIVMGFKAFSIDIKSVLIRATGAEVSVGDPQLYAFVNDEKTYIGSLENLRPTIELFAAQNSDKKSLVMQIAELIGTDEAKKVARVDMRAFILTKQGEAAANSFYEGSVLRSALWRRLLEAATDRSMAPSQRGDSTKHGQIKFILRFASARGH